MMNFIIKLMNHQLDDEIVHDQVVDDSSTHFDFP